MPSAKLLLIEDNPRIQLANRDMLSLLGYQVATAASLCEAWEVLSGQSFDAIVLDIMLPDGSGLDFLARLRQRSVVPVLMLTALNTAEDTVAGLCRGADDYLAKPYDYKVLAARIEALLRRAGRVPETLMKGPLRLDVIAGQAFLHGTDMLLTQKEFACLLLLAQNEGRTLSSGYLYESVWRQPMSSDSQALRSAIARLRGKLSDSGWTIVSRRREGYCFLSEENP